jgi:hypothetical protein
VADIFKEVDEELRREGLERLWQRYGKYVIGIAVAIVLATAGYVGWQRYVEKYEADRARAYAAAVEQLAGPASDGASQAFAELVDGGDGYAALARLHEAALKVRAGKIEEAVALYEAMIADDSIDRPFRELAVILLSMQSADTAPAAELTARLEPLTQPTSAFRHAALELTAILAKREGDIARAREIFVGLADDPEAPPALRARAAEMLAALKG